MAVGVARFYYGAKFRLMFCEKWHSFFMVSVASKFNVLYSYHRDCSRIFSF